MAGSGGAAAAGALDHAARTMAKVVMEIANSPDFDREQIRGEKLTLSQAYCLLWQNSEDGNVGGRRFGFESNSGATAAVIVDLIALGKVEIEIEPNTTMGVKNDHYRLKVVDEKPTGTYLDEALFNGILKHHEKHPDKPEKVKSVIFDDISQLRSKNYCSTITLDSLVELGILEMKEKMMGRKYPTVNKGPEESLEKQIREVVLQDMKPSSYIRVLLVLARHADNLMCLEDPVLKKHFSKEEYGKAKEKINQLVGL
nr:uncharacterized protein LOC131773654 [Pocillopora verrucosa]